LFMNYYEYIKILCAFYTYINYLKILSVPKLSANLYCICLSIDFMYTEADAVQICGIFWDTQYNIRER